jgi:hypothetical protein
MVMQAEIAFNVVNHSGAISTSPIGHLKSISYINVYSGMAVAEKALRLEWIGH